MKDFFFPESLGQKHESTLYTAKYGKWICTIYGLSWLISSTSHNVFKVYAHCGMCQYFTPFYGWIIFHLCYGYITFYLLIYPLMDIWIDWNLGLIQVTLLWTFMFKVFVWTYVSNSPGYIPRSRIAGSHDHSLSEILRTCQAVCQSGCTIPHSYQQGLSLPASSSALPAFFFLF